MITYYTDQSSDFWPSGWMIWFCIVLGCADIGLFGLLFYQLFHKG